MSRPSSVLRNHVALTFMPCFMAGFRPKEKIPATGRLPNPDDRDRGPSLWPRDPQNPVRFWFWGRMFRLHWNYKGRPRRDHLRVNSAQIGYQARPERMSETWRRETPNRSE